MAQFDDMNEQEQMQMLMSQLQDSNLRQSVMQYINQTANSLDKDANSKALIETLARESVHNQKNTAMWKARTKKSMAAGVVAVVLAITVQFLVNYFTNELSKESHVDKQGAMVSTDGKVVKTQMEEMKVDADGKLLSRNGDAAVKTMPSLAKVALASSLPDATLMALDEITVHSDKGYTLQIKVHGFSRVPVLNSRCGNVVHFYTAWKGKVTLDSTDLSFDEATAAEFKNAGFSLATGGRRLAGKITVDGFAKALDGMREGGKWSCADVPLPTFSELGDRKETSYSLCGTKSDKTSNCYSNYGGLKIGVAALEGSLAAAVTSHTDLVKGEQTEKMFVKSSSAVMNSELFRVSFSEYAMHPGQQLVAISDLASGKEVRFQMETDKTRSHCVVADDKVQQTDQEAKKSAKVDSEYHFEYMGTSEEDGRVLRHFRIMLSSEYTKFVFGDASAASLPNFAEFWDVAETMQPQRLLLGGADITVFDSYKQGMSDADVQAAVKARTGKSVADLMTCSAQEASRETERPEMSLFADLETQDADYYTASSATKSEALKQYLDATQKTTAMPDVCYDKCKAAVDAVVSADTTDICEGATLKNALSCLEETGMTACSTSVFSNQHSGECDGADNDTSVRTLEESGDAVELLVNETPRAVSETRNLNVYAKCYKKFKKTPIPNGAYRVTPTDKGLAECVRWDFELWKGDFILEIGWMRIASAFAFWMKLALCIDLGTLWGIPAPLFAEFCIGGRIDFSFSSPCPQVKGIFISGSAYMVFEIGLDFWICRIVFASLKLGFEAGLGWATIATQCWWVHNDGWRRRRRWWTRRRRNWRGCNYRNDCDIYVKGYVELTILIVKAKLEFVYWCKNKIFQIWIRLYAWFWKWHEAYAMCVYQRNFR